MAARGDDSTTKGGTWPTIVPKASQRLMRKETGLTEGMRWTAAGMRARVAASLRAGIAAVTVIVGALVCHPITAIAASAPGITVTAAPTQPQIVHPATSTIVTISATDNTVGTALSLN